MYILMISLDILYRFYQCVYEYLKMKENPSFQFLACLNLPLLQRTQKRRYAPVWCPTGLKRCHMKVLLKISSPRALEPGLGALVVARRSFRSRTGGALLATARGLPQVAPGNLVALLLGPPKIKYLIQITCECAEYWVKYCNILDSGHICRFLGRTFTNCCLIHE